MLLQVRIAAVQNSDIRCLSLKVNALLCPEPHPTLIPPDSVNKFKTDMKTYLLMQPCYFNFLTCRFELFCRTIVTRDLNRSSSRFKVSLFVTYLIIQGIIRSEM